MKASLEDTVKHVSRHRRVVTCDVSILKTHYIHVNKLKCYLQIADIMMSDFYKSAVEF